MQYDFGYKLVCIAAGVFIIYLGYRLFAKGFFRSAGSLEGEIKGTGKLTITNAAPGTFFTALGAIVICCTVFKGFEHDETLKEETQTVAGKEIEHQTAYIGKPIQILRDLHISVDHYYYDSKSFKSSKKGHYAQVAETKSVDATIDSFLHNGSLLPPHVIVDSTKKKLLKIQYDTIKHFTQTHFRGKCSNIPLFDDEEDSVLKIPAATEQGFYRDASKDEKSNLKKFEK